MGTNYYLYKDVCPTCSHPKEKLHIGKSSGGWVFLIQIYPERELNNLNAWKKLINEPNQVIKDEYGIVVTPEELFGCIENRKGNGFDDKPWGYDSWEDVHYGNHSEEGPNGLLRGCNHIRGEGTYDYYEGEFS